MGSTERNKGLDYERKLRLEFIDLGFEDVHTSRFASKKRDDECVDLEGVAGR